MSDGNFELCCACCRFWRKTAPDPSADGDNGECRRFPPVFNPCVALSNIGRGLEDAATETPSKGYSWIFPIVLGYEHCGEFQPTDRHEGPGRR